MDILAFERFIIIESKKGLGPYRPSNSKSLPWAVTLPLDQAASSWFEIAYNNNSSQTSGKKIPNGISLPQKKSLNLLSFFIKNVHFKQMHTLWIFFLYLLHLKIPFILFAYLLT